MISRNLLSLLGIEPRIVHSAGKVKGKITLRTGPEEKKKKYNSTLSLTSALDASGWSTPRPCRFTAGKESQYPLYRRLNESKGRCGRVRKISSRTDIRFPDLPARSESLYRLSYPAHSPVQLLFWPPPRGCNWINYQQIGGHNCGLLRKVLDVTVITWQRDKTKNGLSIRMPGCLHHSVHSSPYFLQAKWEVLTCCNQIFIFPSEWQILKAKKKKNSIWTCSLI